MEVDKWGVGRREIEIEAGGRERKSIRLGVIKSILFSSHFGSSSWVRH